MRGCSPRCRRISARSSGSGMHLHHPFLVCADLHSIHFYGICLQPGAQHAHACNLNVFPFPSVRRCWESLQALGVTHTLYLSSVPVTLTVVR